MGCCKYVPNIECIKENHSSREYLDVWQVLLNIRQNTVCIFSGKPNLRVICNRLSCPGFRCVRFVLYITDLIDMIYIVFLLITTGLMQVYGIF